MEEKRYAICIGCDSYPLDPENLHSLRCSENNAREMERILADPNRGEFNHVRLFTSEPNHVILQSIEEYLTKAETNDTVLIYYSGHGKLDRSNKLHLCTANTRMSLISSTSLPAGTIKNFINASCAKEIVWILDCCYSGQVNAEYMENELSIAVGSRGLYIITSSTGIEVSRERENERHSVFTKYLLEGLRGEADLNRDGIVTIGGLFDYVQQKLLTDEGGQKQEPLQFVFNVKYNIPIAKAPLEGAGVPQAPYLLGRTRLSLTKFPDVLEETADRNGKIDIAFVIGSGRYPISDHTSYGTDALLIPEISALLKDQFKEKINLSSCLDIDIYNTEDIKNKNLFLIGSGKVNYVTMSLLEIFGNDLSVKFSFPGVGDILSNCHIPPRYYQVEEEHPDWDIGILSLTKNPWAAKIGKQRIVVLVAGAHPIGTIAVNSLLIDYIKNQKNRKDNKLDPNVPAKIVRGSPIEYTEYLERMPLVTEKTKKTPTYIGNINGWKVVE